MLDVAVLTISDSCAGGRREDESGKLIQDILKNIHAEIIEYDIVPDDKEAIKEKLIYYCDKLRVDFVFTSGGTGLGLRDVTPEATLEIAHRNIPGIPELMRSEGLKITKKAMLSRAVSVIRNSTIIINLPGSSDGSRESLWAVLDIVTHAHDMLKGGGH